MKVRSWFIIAALLFSLPMGCSTPARRAHERAPAFRKLSAADQKLVLHDKIRVGMSKDAVYIAWGSPDLKMENGKGPDDAQAWLYARRLTIAEPFGATDQFGPYHGLGFSAVPFRSSLGYGFHGIGDSAFGSYQPHVRVIDVRYRRAVFSDDKLVRYVDRQDELQAMAFLTLPAPVLAPVPAPAPDRTASVPDKAKTNEPPPPPAARHTERVHRHLYAIRLQGTSVRHHRHVDPEDAAR